MSSTFVTIFTIALIMFAIYGFFSFLIMVNRKMKKSANKPKIKRKEENHNEVKES